MGSGQSGPAPPALDLKGKVAIVTGGSSGYGFVVAEKLADWGARVIIGCRNAAKGKDATERIKASTKNSLVEAFTLDLASLASVKAFVDEFADIGEPLDILINNAATTQATAGTTADSLELTTGVNHYGHFALTIQLLPFLKRAPAARVVVVADAGNATSLDLDNKEKYDGATAYHRSKLMNLLFMYELNRILVDEKSSILVNAAYPGNSASPVGAFSHGGAGCCLANQSLGASTIEYVAASPNVKTGGSLYRASVITNASALARNAKLARELWVHSETVTKQSYGPIAAAIPEAIAPVATEAAQPVSTTVSPRQVEPVTEVSQPVVTVPGSAVDVDEPRAQTPPPADTDAQSRDTPPPADDDDEPVVRRPGRRVAVSAEAGLEPEAATAARVYVEKSAEDRVVIEKVLRGNLLFRDLAPEHLSAVIDSMVRKEIEVGDKVIQQGDDGDLFYIVQDGDFIVLKDDGQGDKQVASVGRGGCFGELALMYNMPRAATVQAKTTAIVWVTDRQTFRSVLMNCFTEQRDMYEGFLNKVELFRENMDRFDRARLADAFETTDFAADTVIVKEAEPGDAFYVIQSGQTEVTKAGVVVNTLSDGQYFGELALLSAAPRAATVTAKTALKVAILQADAFERLIPEHVKDRMRGAVAAYQAQAAAAVAAAATQASADAPQQ